jgi:hypothetical protein
MDYPSASSSPSEIPVPPRLICSLAILTFLLGSLLPAQQKLHPFLAEKLQASAAGDFVPVYFVIGDRLSYEHWFPRVNRLRVEERRALVITELKAHAQRSQAPLMAVLRDLLSRGEVRELRSNWLGNFVQCEATPFAILTASEEESVENVWYDDVPPLHRVEDSPRVGDPASDPEGAAPLPFLNPGNGPLHTRADLVWNLGITGQGVVIMNADSGLNEAHGDLVGRLWTNPGEILGNGLDDDNNGFVDDIRGWNFGGNSAALSDNGGHGTQTAGCLVADGGCSVTQYGQAPGAQLMTGRLGGESSQWAAIQYALDKGAHLQTSSHSYKNDFNPPPNYKMHRDIGDASLAAGLIRTNSTSNNGSQCSSATSFNRRPFNIAAPGCLPAPYLDPNQTGGVRKGGVMGIAAHSLTTTALMSYSPCGPFAWSLTDLLAVRPTYDPSNWDSVNHDDFPWSGGTLQGLLKPDLSAPTGTTTTASGTCNTSTFSGTSNATPVACGVLALWKSANMSLKPEDIAMIAHQTAIPSGTTAGKENGYGAGRIDARAGLDLALCVHRINGEPAWAVQHSVAQPISIEVDGVPNSLAIVAIGTARIATATHGGVIGIGGSTLVIWQGTTDAQGDVDLNFALPPALAGLTVYSQVFIGDVVVTNAILTSNVVATTFVP